MILLVIRFVTFVFITENINQLTVADHWCLYKYIINVTLKFYHIISIRWKMKIEWENDIRILKWLRREERIVDLPLSKVSLAACMTFLRLRPSPARTVVIVLETLSVVLSSSSLFAHSPEVVDARWSRRLIGDPSPPGIVSRLTGPSRP